MREREEHWIRYFKESYSSWILFQINITLETHVSQNNSRNIRELPFSFLRIHRSTGTLIALTHHGSRWTNSCQVALASQGYCHQGVWKLATRLQAKHLYQWHDFCYFRRFIRRRRTIRSTKENRVNRINGHVVLLYCFSQACQDHYHPGLSIHWFSRLTVRCKHGTPRLVETCGIHILWWFLGCSILDIESHCIDYTEIWKTQARELCWSNYQGWNCESNASQEVFLEAISGGEYPLIHTLDTDCTFLFHWKAHTWFRFLLCSWRSISYQTKMSISSSRPRTTQLSSANTTTAWRAASWTWLPKKVMFSKNSRSQWYEIESDATTSLILSQPRRNGEGNLSDFWI